MPSSDIERRVRGWLDTQRDLRWPGPRESYNLTPEQMCALVRACAARAATWGEIERQTLHDDLGSVVSMDHEWEEDGGPTCCFISKLVEMAEHHFLPPPPAPREEDGDVN